MEYHKNKSLSNTWKHQNLLRYLGQRKLCYSKYFIYVYLIDVITLLNATVTDIIIKNKKKSANLGLGLRLLLLLFFSTSKYLFTFVSLMSLLLNDLSVFPFLFNVEWKYGCLGIRNMQSSFKTHAHAMTSIKHLIDVYEIKIENEYIGKPFWKFSLHAKQNSWKFLQLMCMKYGVTHSWMSWASLYLCFANCFYESNLLLYFV